MSKVSFTPADVTRSNVAEARAEAPSYGAPIAAKIGRYVLKDGVKLLVLNGATLADERLEGAAGAILLEEHATNNLDAYPLAEGEEQVNITVRLQRLWDFADSHHLNVTPLIPCIAIATLFDDEAWDLYPKAVFQHEIIDTILPDLVVRAMEESEDPTTQLMRMIRKMAQQLGDIDNAPVGCPTLH